jgi:hypothetical protein
VVMDTSRPFWGPKRFAGRVSRGRRRVRCSFAAEIARDGTLHVKLDELHIGTRFPEFRLVGVGDDGGKLQSDRVIFTSPGHRSNAKGSYFVSAGSCVEAKLILKKEPNDTSTQVKHHLIGFQSFSFIEVPTPYGPLRMGGAKDVPHTEIGGILFLDASQDQPVSRTK